MGKHIHDDARFVSAESRPTVSIRLDANILRAKGLGVFTAEIEGGRFTEVEGHVIIEIPAETVPYSVAKAMSDSLVIMGLSERDAEGLIDDMLDKANKLLFLKYIS